MSHHQSATSSVPHANGANGMSDQKQNLLADPDHEDRQSISLLPDANLATKSSKRRRCIWFCVGFIASLFALQLTFVPDMISSAVRTDITTAFIFTEPLPGNAHYEQWITNAGSDSVPIIFSIQFFNVTNPDAVLRGAMPKLKLVGPLVYNQYFYRQNVNFYPGGEYVNHTFYTEYLYNEELSKISPNEKLTVMSPLVSTLNHEYSVSKRLEHEEMKEIVKIFEDDPSLLYWSGTASELIWSIYRFEHLGFKFEWGFMRNQSNQYYVLHTGYKDEQRMGEVQRWCRDPLNMSCLLDESTEYIDAWDPPMSLKPAHLFYEGVYTLLDAKDKNEVPPLWIDILFRNVYLEYNGTYTMRGLQLYKYGIQIDPLLANVSQYPPNEQFNQFGPSGILNCSAAYDDVLIFLSMVLFYGAPDYMANNSQLGVPDPGPFDYAFIDIEPKTGAVFYANASMQINTPIHSLPNVNNVSINHDEPSLFNLVNGMMMPVYLVTFADQVPDDIVDTFKKNMSLGNTLHTVSIVVGWCSVGFLLIWAFISVFAAGARYAESNAKRQIN